MEVSCSLVKGPDLLIISFPSDRHPHEFSAIDIIFISYTIKMDEQLNKRNDEHNANKRVCLLHSIRKNPSTMTREC